MMHPSIAEEKRLLARAVVCRSTSPSIFYTNITFFTDLYHSFRRIPGIPPPRAGHRYMRCTHSPTNEYAIEKVFQTFATETPDVFEEGDEEDCQCQNEREDKDQTQKR